MKIESQLTDEALLQELGRRLAGVRIAQNLTQEALAEQAGIAKRTVERMESGAVAIQFSSFLRVCRVLGLLDLLNALLPEPNASPMQQLQQQVRKRQRASRRKPVSTRPWTWGEKS